MFKSRTSIGPIVRIIFVLASSLVTGLSGSHATGQVRAPMPQTPNLGPPVSVGPNTGGWPIPGVNQPSNVNLSPTLRTTELNANLATLPRPTASVVDARPVTPAAVTRTGESVSASGPGPSPPEPGSGDGGGDDSSSPTPTPTPTPSPAFPADSTSREATYDGNANLASTPVEIYSPSPSTSYSPETDSSSGSTAWPWLGAVLVVLTVIGIVGKLRSR